MPNKIMELYEELFDFNMANGDLLEVSLADQKGKQYVKIRQSFEDVGLEIIKGITSICDKFGASMKLKPYGTITIKIKENT